MSFCFSEKSLFCRIQYGCLVLLLVGKLILYDYESIPLVSNTGWAYMRPRLLASNSSLYTTEVNKVQQNFHCEARFLSEVF